MVIVNYCSEEVLCLESSSVRSIIISSHLFVQDLCVVLGLKVSVAQHLADCFNGNTVGKRGGGGKGVPRCGRLIGF